MIQSNALGSIISGGRGNRINTNASFSIIGGGESNTIQTNADYSTIGGGKENCVSDERSVVAGGYANTNSGAYAAIGGGHLNRATATWAGVAGGYYNEAAGQGSTVPGGAHNVAGGDYSFAAGRTARALHEGAFVWADSNPADFNSTAANQFLIRADRAGIGTNAPQAKLDVAESSDQVISLRAINTGSGNYVQAGGNWYGVFASGSGYDFYAGGPGVDYGSSSSRRWKQNVHDIKEPLEKLDRLRGVYFDWDAAHGGRHDVGMIAEEVGAVLPEIVSYETNGVDAVAMDYSKVSPLLVEAVKALRAEKDAEIEELKARVNQLEQLLNHKLNGGAD